MAFETDYDAVTLAAWETWTNNGLNMDEEDRKEALQQVRDAATNSWVDGMSEIEWLRATLNRLGVDQE
jgi:hypothetical protein